MCRRPMPAVTIHLSGRVVELDGCSLCQSVWFDPQEFECLPPPAPEQQTKLSPEAKKAVALLEVALAADTWETQKARWQAKQEAQPRVPSFSDLGGQNWKMIPALLGLPAVVETPSIPRNPWFTWTLAAAIVLVACLTIPILDRVLPVFALIPGDPWRLGGLTFVTSFFLHGGLLHLAGNVYFLLLFGDNVEDSLGWKRYAVLLALATLAGDLLQMALDPRSTMPSVGASGGISGVIAFYALSFPRARIGIWIWRAAYWWKMSARTAFIVWVLFQLLLAALQHLGVGDISGLAHLGGASVGLLFWRIWKQD